MIKNAQWIRNQNGMIVPMYPNKIRAIDGIDAISFGVSGFGYDLRLSPSEFRVCNLEFNFNSHRLIDPKEFSESVFYTAVLHDDDDSGKYFILPGYSWALGVSVEYLNIPDNVEVLFIGKSTYARCGIIVNMTPGESGWRGHLTIEIINPGYLPVKIYANEGICQALFFEGEPTDTLYGSGKYQDQSAEVTFAKK